MDEDMLWMMGVGTRASVAVLLQLPGSYIFLHSCPRLSDSFCSLGIHGGHA